MRPAAGPDSVWEDALHHRFVRVADHTPDRPAVELKHGGLTFGELRDDAFRVCRWLQAHGPSTLGARRVAIFAERSTLAFSGILGSLAAGAMYVPMNRRFPVARLLRMCQRADIDAAIVDAGFAPIAAEVLRQLDRPVPVLGEIEVVGARTSDTFSRGLSCVRQLSRVLPDDPAYLLFTSGTTGEPKGVAVTHGNVNHYVDALHQRFPIRAGDRCSHTFDLTFDLSVHDMFVTWLAGACLVVPDAVDLLTPVRYAVDRALSVWFSVPSLASLAIRRRSLSPGALSGLRLSQFCGEPLPIATARAWLEASPNSEIVNLYGPTELTIACFEHRFSPQVAGDGFVSIGRPLPGLGAVLLDETLSVTDGDIGELAVCGAQTALGYWHDETRTAEKFISLPTGDGFPRRFYRTGDRVRRLADGTYTFVGRVDSQVKIGGFRVELGEIESQVLAIPGVVQAAAVAHPTDALGTLGIILFFTGQATAQDIMDRLRASVPDYMLPKRIVSMDAMPLNANGKIDRQQLAATLAPPVTIGTT